MALTGATLLSHQLICAQSQGRDSPVGMRSAQTCVRPVGTAVLAHSQAHLDASRLAGEWLWRPSIQPRQGQRRDEQELARGTAVVLEGFVFWKGSFYKGM